MMERRDFLRRALAGAVALAAAPDAVQAAIAHGCYAPKHDRVRCTVGVQDAPYIEPQACRAICWANALAYVLRGWGMNLSVASVVHRLEVPGDCRARDDAAILTAASGIWSDDTGRTFTVQVRRLPDLEHGSYTTEQFVPWVRALERGPLIVGTPGHSRVLTAMTYTDMPMVLMRQEELTLRDPWTGTPNLLHLPVAETPERMFVLSVRARRL